jgi:hypothetical protein
MKSSHDLKLVYMLDEAVSSMKKGEGIRSGFYLRAAYNYVHGINSNEVEIALENYYS